jgi:hypothetical protein
VTSIAESARGPRLLPALRVLVLVALLALFGAQTPMPWGGLWLLVPVSVAVSLLAGWRFGIWSVLVPLSLLAATMIIAGPLSLWAWWVPVTALTGAWMGMREEGGPTGGQRAWMLLPILLLAAGLPWTLHYPDLIGRVDRELKASDSQLIDVWRQLGYRPDQFAALQGAREKMLPQVFPTVLFIWVALLVAAGRSLSARIAALLRWPALSRTRLSAWRLPDGALWLMLVGLAVLVAQWTAWKPTGWTLLLNTGLGFCVQGIAVVESWFLARGVPPAIIVVTMLFVFGVATPLFMLTAAAVGLSDVWLDYRRIEPSADEQSN